MEMVSISSESGRPADALPHPTHCNCVVCAQRNAGGLRLQFHQAAGGVVAASFDCGRQFEGYEGMIHGGVISSLLDGAMTNCLFAKGIVAFTAELKVRFKRPVRIGLPATVKAVVDDSVGALHVVKATLLQEGKVKATGTGKFLEPPPEQESE